MTQQIPLTQGMYTLVDDEDFEWLNQYKWHLSPERGNCYAVGWVNGKMVRMHHLLLPGAKLIDHINGLGTDNRRVNLREVTASQNMLNPANNLSIRNTSGRRGVVFDKFTGRWKAQGALPGRRCISLGRYDRFEDAVAARERWEQANAVA